jgi:hypothetical protein
MFRSIAVYRATIDFFQGNVVKFNCSISHATHGKRRVEDPFPGRIISKGLWPPRSPDLSPLDFFLCGHLKSVVYLKHPHTVAELRANIQHYVANISRDTIRKVFRNMIRWVNLCEFVDGSHFQHLWWCTVTSHGFRDLLNTLYMREYLQRISAEFSFTLTLISHAYKHKWEPPPPPSHPSPSIQDPIYNRIIIEKHNIILGESTTNFDNILVFGYNWHRSPVYWSFIRRDYSNGSIALRSRVTNVDTF